MDKPPRGPDAGYALPAAGERDAGGAPDARLDAPAALRNRDAIAEALAHVAPARGRALEIASGTGQHVIRFARALHGLTWQPTDPAADRRASIAAWCAAEPAPNIRPPRALDACAPGWGAAWAAAEGAQDLVFLANLLHLVTVPEAATCLSEIASVLAPGGVAAVYGPFLRGGRTTSEGDAAFDARIRAEMPGAGYKDAEAVRDIWRAAGLVPGPPRPMPANNLLLLARKPADPVAT